MQRKKQRGAQSLEITLVLLPLAGLLFLIIDISWAIFTKATLQHATCEGVRFAITGRTLPGLGHDASIRTVVQRNAIGLLNGSNVDKIAIRYYRSDTLAETADNGGGNVVQISVEGYSLRPLGPILRSNTPLSLTARAYDRMEGSPGGVPPVR